MSQVTHEVVESALGGDADAMRALIRALRPVIQARAARTLLRYARAAKGAGVRQEVEDLVQHVFLQLFADGARGLRQWSPERGMGLLNYVGLVAERDVISILRSRKQTAWVEQPVGDEELDAGPAPEPSPESELASREMRIRVVAMLREELSEKGAAILELLIIEEQPVEHVCAVMDMTPDAVYAWRSRIVRRARAIAEELSRERPPTTRARRAGVEA